MTTIDLNHETISINPTDDLTLYDKNNIMSRIEKFLFAICSLDSSDLPVPLSRIEELYYCLVTGDIPPTFEPLSRAEKFLMACLGVYDINKLPEPLSRSEVLLKKIATGDSNLEDVDNLQSKYEFLLAYIIQNGGIGDFDEYVLNTQFNTLYNTKEKLIKSAILKGNTLVNIVPSYVIDYTATNDWDGFNGLTQASNPKGYSWKALQDVKPNTKYFISCYVETFDVDGNGYYINNRDNQTIFSDSLQVDGAGLYKWIVTSKSELTDETYFILRCQNGHARGTIKIKDFMVIEYQDGMENWDIPYFTGMTSVKMPVLKTTGKNLFNPDMLTLGGNNYASNTQFLPYDKNLTRAVLKRNNLIEVKPNSTLTLSCDSRFKLVIQEYDENEIRTMPGDKGWHTNGYQTLTVSANTKKVNLYFTKQDPHSETDITSEEFEVLKNSIQLEENSVGKILFDGNMKVGTIQGSDGNDVHNYETRMYTPNFIPVSSKSVTASTTSGLWIGVFGYDKNKNYLGYLGNPNGVVTYTNESLSYVRLSTDDLETYHTIQLVEEGSVATPTPYEPFKSNILTVNEEVELRGIGDVKDELNVLTGEFTQRIGEVVLDGYSSIETWTLNSTENPEFITFAIPNVKLDFVDHAYTQAYYSLNSDKFNVDYDYKNNRCILTHNDTIANIKWLVITVKRTELSTLDVAGFRSYLNLNPVTVQYQLATPTVKTVDLSVVDQDGNDTKLSTFNDITHVTLSSEGLIPEAELEVATKNEEDLEDSSVYTVHTLSEEFNTLYNTEEKPVKNAILTGETLVNLIDNQMYSYTQSGSIKIDGEYVTITSANEIGTNVLIEITLKQPLEANTLYTLIYLDRGLAPNIILRDIDNATNLLNGENTGIKTFTTTENSTQKLTLYYCYVSVGQKYKHTNNVMIIKGDVSNLTFNNYFEGIQSVKMPVLTTTGKNLFDIDNPKNMGQDYKKTGSTITCLNTSQPVFGYENLDKNKTYTLSFDFKLGSADSSNSLAFAFSDKKQLYNPSTSYFIKLRGNYSVGDVVKIKFNISNKSSIWVQGGWDTFYSNIQIEEGSIATPYEAFKSNILTCNEEVELRGGIGTTKDELNLLTGELTQRIGEIVVDGSESWSLTTEYPSDSAGSFEVYKGINNTWGNYNSNNMTINNIGLNSEHYLDVKQRRMSDFGIGMGHGKIIISVPFSKLSEPNTNGFKTWLQSNPIIVQYRLETPTVKTVDLSVVDQDGNDTKLSTFNDITYVTLSSEGLIPEAELEVAEKVPEIAASILTISREQEVIDSATNKQSENVDATMIATTEIYEGLL